MQLHCCKAAVAMFTDSPIIDLKISASWGSEGWGKGKVGRGVVDLLSDVGEEYVGLCVGLCVGKSGFVGDDGGACGGEQE